MDSAGNQERLSDATRLRKAGCVLMVLATMVFVIISGAGLEVSRAGMTTGFFGRTSLVLPVQLG